MLCIMGMLKRKKPKSGTDPDGLGVPVAVEAAHFNADLDQTRINGLAESYLTGVPAPAMHHDTLRSAMTRLKTIEAPAGCPSDHAEWRKEVTRLLSIAVYKMAVRLAEDGDKMPLSKQSVSLAISLDKILLLSGHPTSFDFSVKAHISHEQLIKKINGHSPAQTDRGH